MIKIWSDLNQKFYIMKNACIKLILPVLILFISTVFAQQKTFNVDSFDEVIISPHIEVSFIQADQESVIIDNLDVGSDKLNVEVKGKTLHIYLDDAKVYTKSEKVKTSEYKSRESIYEGTKVTARVFYKKLNLLSLRGDETHKVESALKGDKLSLKIYGESRVYLNEIDHDEFHTVIYGEAYLEVKQGRADRQKVVSYGESEVNTLGVNNKTAKITAYGEGNIKLNVSDELKITAYGEASIEYKGSPMVSHGLVLGEASIHQIH